MAVLITATAVVAVPFQQAFAQEQELEFLVRIVQGTAQAGLINLSINIGNAEVLNRVIEIDVEDNNIAIPITVPVAANVNVGATVCVGILDGPNIGDEVCKTVQNVKQDAENRVTLNLNQAQ